MENSKWEDFEIECVEYLNTQFGESFNCFFYRSGGHNSHEPDIYVEQSGITVFSMEAKMATAQCGQFVLFPDDKKNKFIYSDQNEFPLNDYAKRIIDEMEKDFDKYKVPSIKPLPFKTKLYYDWVKNHYKVDRNSSFIITKGENFVIFDIDKFEEYFSIQAKYRVKKSGSSNPNSSDINTIKELLKNNDLPYSSVYRSGRHLTVSLLSFKDKRFELKGITHTFLFKQQEGNTFRITKLSNTFNANVIFDIKLKKEQDPKDLKSFEIRIQNTQ